MSAWRFTDNVRVIRRVTVDSGADIVILDALEAWFAAQRVRPGRSRPGSDTASPRRLRTNLIRYRPGVLGPAGAPLRSGDRLDLNGSEFEVLENPREVHLGRRMIGQEVPILEVGLLYPLEGALAEQGGSVVKAAVRFSIYSTDETHDITGTYEDYTAETDLANHEDCRINRQFVSDGRVYKITSAENDLVGGFVRMTVRKSGAS